MGDDRAAVQRVGVLGDLVVRERRLVLEALQLSLHRVTSRLLLDDCRLGHRQRGSSGITGGEGLVMGALVRQLIEPRVEGLKGEQRLELHRTSTIASTWLPHLVGAEPS